jgi:hypothetical protein
MSLTQESHKTGKTKYRNKSKIRAWARPSLHQFKLEVVEVAKETGNREAGRLFNA